MKGMVERVVTVTVHCPIHPEPVLHGWKTTDGEQAMLLGSHEIVPDPYPYDGSPSPGTNSAVFLATPSAGQKANHFEIGCAQRDHRGTRCKTSLRLTEFETKMEEFTCALWSRRGPSLRFFVLSAFLHDLKAYGGPDGLLNILDEFGADRFVAILNRNRAGRHLVCRVAS